MRDIFPPALMPLHTHYLWTYQEAWSQMNKQKDDLNSRLRNGVFTRYLEAVVRPENIEQRALAISHGEDYLSTTDVTLRRWCGAQGEMGGVGLKLYQPSCPGPCIVIGQVRAIYFYVGPTEQN